MSKRRPSIHMYINRSILSQNFMIQHVFNLILNTQRQRDLNTPLHTSIKNILISYSVPIQLTQFETTLRSI